MNAIANQKIVLAEGLVADSVAPTAPASPEALRASGRERFLAMGAPVRRDEYWKYTDPTKLTEPRAAAAPAEGAISVGAGPFDAVAAAVLVFANGRYRPDLSTPPAVDGLEIAPLSDLGAAGWATRALGALETDGQAPVARPFAALNAALATDGVAIRASKPIEQPIHIRYEAVGEGAVYLRHVIEIAPGASLTLLESGIGGDRFNTVLEANIAAGGALHHVRAQNEARIDQVATAIFAKLADESALKSFTLTASPLSGGMLARNEAVLELDGVNGLAHVAGGVLAQGKAHVDNTVFLTHAKDYCESRQVFKTVLGDEARGVFQGKILVKQPAQKTDGYQISQSVLMSERAEFDAKPELEIYADDVKCSHGSTTGALDETSMFYLRSRGVSQAAAEAMLIAAFVEEAIEEIADDALQDAMRDAVAAWMTARSA